MHYSDCNCFLGRGRQQLCMKYNTGKSIGYGTLGAFLGIITVIGIYALLEFILSKDLLCCCVDKGTPLENKVDNVEESAEVINDDEVIPETTNETKSGTLNQHAPKHRHRKCWACEVKYNGAKPPRFYRQGKGFPLNSQTE